MNEKSFVSTDTYDRLMVNLLGTAWSVKPFSVA